MKSRGSWWALSLALLAAVMGPSATMAAAAADTATEEGEQAARRHFAEGDAAYKAGHYEQALKEFEAGYAISRRPGFLLNMGHTERKLGHLREARALYKKYLLVDTTSKLRDEVRSLIGELDSALADEDLAERDPQEPRRDRRRRGRDASRGFRPARRLTAGRARCAHGAAAGFGSAGPSPAGRGPHDARTRTRLDPVLPARLVLGRRRRSRAHGSRRGNLLVEAPGNRPLPRHRHAGFARQLNPAPTGTCRSTPRRAFRSPSSRWALGASGGRSPRGRRRRPRRGGGRRPR